MMKIKPSEVQHLVNWYQKNQRQLPWRSNRDPYRIWVSEVMLQQTTVAAVIPYFERFMKKFPTIEALARAETADLHEAWSGLGYYSRARNLQKSAQAIVTLKRFPNRFEELIELPGFGPYTSRSVASLAFAQPVGVVDGNVVRLLSRRFGLEVEWYKPAGRELLQILADQLVQVGGETHQLEPNQINQALMELGSQVCTFQSPACLLCPWQTSCVARNQGRISELPKPRPRRQREIWIWRPQLHLKKSLVALIKNDYAPFLKGQWMFPGSAERVRSKPSNFDYRHSITHHDIFVQVQQPRSIAKDLNQKLNWVRIDEIKTYNPTALIQKALTQLPSK